MLKNKIMKEVFESKYLKEVDNQIVELSFDELEKWEQEEIIIGKLANLITSIFDFSKEV